MAGRPSMAALYLRVYPRPHGIRVTLVRRGNVHAICFRPGGRTIHRTAGLRWFVPALVAATRLDLNAVRILDSKHHGWFRSAPLRDFRSVRDHLPERGYFPAHTGEVGRPYTCGDRNTERTRDP